MIKIWGRANSNNVKKVLWCAEEAAIPYQRKDAGGAFGLLDTSEFNDLNPNRRVPVLEDGTLIVWESNAIVRYLSAQYAPETLYLPNPGPRALADRWMDWSSISFGPVFVTIFWNLMRVPKEQQDVAAVSRAVEQAGRTLAVADAALRQAPYLSGAAFGMGDIPLGCLMHAWFNLSISRPELPSVTQWYERLLTRAAYQKIVAVPLS